MFESLVLIIILPICLHISKENKTKIVYSLSKDKLRYYFDLARHARNCLQNAHILVILRMRNVSSEPIVSIHTFSDSVVSKTYVSGQERSSSDCADAQTDLGRRCLHMHENTFSLGAAYLRNALF